jgi:hypothetical protein
LDFKTKVLKPLVGTQSRGTDFTLYKKKFKEKTGSEWVAPLEPL